jgi:GxxExxY protein
MIKEEYKYSELTGKIIKCAYTVHGILGCGFQEVIYQRALAIELAENGIAFIREQEMPLHYKDHHIGTRRVDFLVEESVSVEIKAISKIENRDLAQGINYLEAYKFEVGLLINFGAEKLEFKRLMKSVAQLKKGNQIGYTEYKKQQ